jgi:hypothetical protein
MPKNIIYPTTPQTPKFLLKLALTHSFKSISALLFTSVLGTWVLALLSYEIQMHLETVWAVMLVNAISVLLIIFFALTGVIQCNAVYSLKKKTDRRSIQIMLSKSWKILLTLSAYALVWLLILFISSHGLQMVFKPGSAALGLIRIGLGASYLFFLVSTFLLFPLLVMTQKKTLDVLSEVLHVGSSHWLRCFLCLLTWIIVFYLQTGNLALILVPAFIKIPYAMLVLKSLVAVLVIPVLISYTTLLAHDMDLRAQ